MRPDPCRPADAARAPGHGTGQPALRRDQPPDLVEIEAFERQRADVQMAAMGRVERAAQEPDAAVLPGRRPGFGLSAQGRTCPVPRTKYLYVVSCSAPTGPRGGR